jgi:hypothetical protein
VSREQGQRGRYVIGEAIVGRRDLGECGAEVSPGPTPSRPDLGHRVVPPE